MAYIFTAITGGQNVGQAFTRVNQNLAAIEGNQGGGDFLPLSGGTLTGGLSGITFALGEGSYFNTLSSVTLSANRTINLPNKNGTVALLNDLTGFTTGATSGNFVPLTGTSLGSEITGDIEITNSNSLRIKDGTDVNSTEVNISSIDFRDDYNSVKTSLKYLPQVNSNADINIIDTLSDGYMVIAPDPTGNENKFVKGKFEWQEGYGAFSYSKSQIKNVIAYIENQEEHHKKESFKKEYIHFLQKFEIEYNERYIFKDLI
jgi:hypothetical protein